MFGLIQLVFRKQGKRKIGGQLLDLTLHFVYFEMPTNTETQHSWTMDIENTNTFPIEIQGLVQCMKSAS